MLNVSHAETSKHGTVLLFTYADYANEAVCLSVVKA